MNRFRFRLENVLRVRGAEEEAKKRDFGEARREARKAEERLEDTRREIEEHDHLAEDREARPLNARDLLIHFQYSRQLERKKESNLQLLKHTEVIVDARRKELVEANRRKKTLERLRERAMLEHNMAANKEEQAVLDELTAQKLKPSQPREE